MTRTSARPRVCLATTETIRGAMHSLLAEGCKVREGSIGAGYLKIKDDETTVYQAIQKGPGQPWIVSCFTSDRISWEGS